MKGCCCIINNKHPKKVLECYTALLRIILLFKYWLSFVVTGVGLAGQLSALLQVLKYCLKNQFCFSYM